jgi:WD40 repeat protein
MGILVSNSNSLTLFASTPSGGLVACNAKTGEHQFLKGHIGRVSCIASSRDWLATGGTDTTTSIWPNINPSAPRHTVTSSRDEVVACAIGQNFGIVASATRDGSISLIVIRTGATSCAVTVQETPVLVLVTPGWGFVLVHSTKLVDAISHFYLTLFSVNGDLIRKCELPCGIQYWTTWESRKGFDYVAAVSNNGDVVVFEAFFLEVGQPIGKVLGSVATMKYFRDEELLFIVSDTQYLVYSSVQTKLAQLERFQFGTK